MHLSAPVPSSIAPRVSRPVEEPEPSFWVQDCLGDFDGAPCVRCGDFLS